MCGGVLGIFVIAGTFNYTQQYKSEYVLIPSSITHERIQEIDADAYIVDMDGMFAPILSYYDNKHPIFARAKHAPEADPYPNMFVHEDFNHTKYKRVMILVGLKQKPQKKFAKYYNVTYIGIKFAEGNWADAYLLTAPQK